jgi:hypothetical protein
MVIKHRKYSLGVLLDTFWLIFSLTAIWGSLPSIVVSILWN